MLWTFLRSTEKRLCKTLSETKGSFGQLNALQPTVAVFELFGQRCGVQRRFLHDLLGTDRKLLTTGRADSQ